MFFPHIFPSDACLTVLSPKDYHRKNDRVVRGVTVQTWVARNYRALLYQATGLCPHRYSTRPTLNGPQGPQIWAG